MILIPSICTVPLSLLTKIHITTNKQKLEASGLSPSQELSLEAYGSHSAQLTTHFQQLTSILHVFSKSIARLWLFEKGMVYGT